MHGQDNQVLLLVRYPPKVAISKLVNSLKGVSSRMLRQERPDLARPLLERRAVVAFLRMMLTFLVFAGRSLGFGTCGRLPNRPPHLL